MDALVNEVVIDAKPSEILRWCEDVEKWPEIFPGCIAVSRQVVGEREMIMDMKVADDRGTNSLRLHWRCLASARQFVFEHAPSAGRTERVRGWWQVTEENGLGRVRIVQMIFASESTAPPERMAECRRLRGVLHQHTDRSLQALKSWIETRTARRMTAGCADRKR